MKQVLIPTDFSLPAQEALQYVRRIFWEEACTFTLVNTYTPSIPNSRFMSRGNTIQPLQNAGPEASKRGLEQAIANSYEALPNPKHVFKYFSSYNLLAQEVADLAASLGVDLIVLGSRGAGEQESGILGSNTIRILNRVRFCPVLSVPVYHNLELPQKIVLLTDGMRPVSRKELSPLVTLATFLDIPVSLFCTGNAQDSLCEVRSLNMKCLKEQLCLPDPYGNVLPVDRVIEEGQSVIFSTAGEHLLCLPRDPYAPLEKTVGLLPLPDNAVSRLPIIFLPHLPEYSNSSQVRDTYMIGRV
ncbi:Nucleotide-binding universal stress protein, UspA family [Robiginitalea myxolifaciens]|uniref:Nucleotide-binding universal stress protein, UspA family n=1 Tax=Robiginitalea myxolifaciens TaxID=400055 RepID=A0A1I6GC82_9FLAO|nr:universal stress protein [Robiginitalea myxolifaciens]SFR39802.1 Nucleotide-binding universal stress protein, UspA family [Robiginitalea myxolifaciens]